MPVQLGPRRIQTLLKPIRRGGPPTYDSMHWSYTFMKPTTKAYLLLTRRNLDRIVFRHAQMLLDHRNGGLHCPFQLCILGRLCLLLKSR
jgi:hypothetical protein